MIRLRDRERVEKERQSSDETAEVIRLQETVEATTTEAVVTMLHESIADLKRGERKANRALVLFLDKTPDPEGGDPFVQVGWANSGMTAMEILGLLKIAESQMIDQMGF